MFIWLNVLELHPIKPGLPNRKCLDHSSDGRLPIMSSNQRYQSSESIEVIRKVTRNDAVNNRERRNNDIRNAVFQLTASRWSITEPHVVLKWIYTFSMNLLKVTICCWSVIAWDTASQATNDWNNTNMTTICWCSFAHQNIE